MNKIQEQFQEEINLSLYKSLVYFINRGYGRSHGIWVRIMDIEQFDIPVKTNCMYLGEFLERFEELGFVTLTDVRAIALSVGACYLNIDSSMYYGSQLSNFKNKIAELYKEDMDIYLAAALYRMDHKVEELGILSTLYSYIPSSVYELSSIMFAFYNDSKHMEGYFETHKDVFLDLLTGGHRIPVFGNELIYAYAISQIRLFTNKKAKYRPLNAIFSLADKVVTEKSAAFKALMNAGFTDKDIFYLNHMMVPYIYESGLDDSKKQNRTASNYVRTALSSTEELSSGEKELLLTLMKDYQYLSPKINGCKTMQDYIFNNVKLNNDNNYLWFINLSGDKINDVSFYSFDLLDSNKEELLKQLNPDQLSTLLGYYIRNLGTYDPLAISKVMNRIKDITGFDYLKSFESENNDFLIFRVLVDINLIDLKQYIPELSTDNTTLERNVSSYIRGIQNRISYEFLHEFFNSHSVLDYDLYFSLDLIDSICKESWFTITWDLTLFKDITKEEFVTVFNWLEEYVYQKRPEKYLSLIKALLQHEKATDYFEVSILTEYYLLLETEFSDYESEKLAPVYMDEAEIAKREKLRTEEEQRIEEEKTAKLALQLEEYLASFTSLNSLYDNLYYSSIIDNQYCYYLALDYIENYINNQDSDAMGNLDTLALLKFYWHGHKKEFLKLNAMDLKNTFIRKGLN